MWGESHFHTSALPLMLPTSAEERDEGWGGAVEPSHAHILPTRTIVFSPCPFPPPPPPLSNMPHRPPPPSHLPATFGNPPSPAAVHPPASGGGPA